MLKNDALKVSYYEKKPTVCPACEESFKKEELLSGSGRLIAGALTEELHRLYEPSAKYGDLYPLAYQAVVCPKCWFASMADDFKLLPEDKRAIVADAAEARMEEAYTVFPKVDFYKPRDLISGAVSQYLVMRCYDYYQKEFSPTAKAGLAALRAAWLLEEMNKKEAGQHWDWLAELFKRKASFYYSRALVCETTGKETLSNIKFFGPDIDKNYGYEGFLYITGLLEFKYGDRSDEEARRENIASTKRTIAKMFGLGKSSKNKPGPLLEKARGLYDDIAEELNDFDD
ncbi:MAG: DUF2225 domain-containing protein [Termitinemataceae bacterium]|jgi:uncharacterized protein (DUF2225 family)|nr:MAG: DUF2225 domain-containing protein [Termitinemataceae bacterium]